MFQLERTCEIRQGELELQGAQDIPWVDLRIDIILLAEVLRLQGSDPSYVGCPIRMQGRSVLSYPVILFGRMKASQGVL